MSNTLDKQALIKARELISNEKDWFRISNGIRNNQSGAYCAYLAVLQGATSVGLIGRNSTDEEDQILVVCKRLTGRSPSTLIKFNDKHEHHEVVQLFDELLAA